MDDSPALLTRRHRIGKRFATFTVGPASFVVEWEPDAPTYLSRKEWRTYRAARDAALAEAAAKLGAIIAVIE